MSDPSAASIANDWAILTSEKGDQVSLYRLRKTQPPAGFWTLVTIEWTYPGSGYNGFPAPELCEQMAQFEDAIGDLTDKTGLSWLALVITGLGLKEWSFYARAYEDFIREFNELLRGHPVAPIKIKAREDPDCSYWSGYRKHLS